MRSNLNHPTTAPNNNRCPDDSAGDLGSQETSWYENIRYRLTTAVGYNRTGWTAMEVRR